MFYHTTERELTLLILMIIMKYEEINLEHPLHFTSIEYQNFMFVSKQNYFISRQN